MSERPWVSKRYPGPYIGYNRLTAWEPVALLLAFSAAVVVTVVLPENLQGLGVLLALLPIVLLILGVVRQSRLQSGAFWDKQRSHGPQPPVGRTNSNTHRSQER